MHSHTKRRDEILATVPCWTALLLAAIMLVSWNTKPVHRPETNVPVGAQFNVPLLCPVLCHGNKVSLQNIFTIVVSYFRDCIISGIFDNCVIIPFHCSLFWYVVCPGRRRQNWLDLFLNSFFISMAQWWFMFFRVSQVMLLNPNSKLTIGRQHNAGPLSLYAVALVIK